jgi:hypothetical protein
VKEALAPQGVVLADAEVLWDWAGAALVAAKKARRMTPRRAPRTVMVQGW